jgi:hypothetical protein
VIRRLPRAVTHGPAMPTPALDSESLSQVLKPKLITM